MAGALTALLLGGASIQKAGAQASVLEQPDNYTWLEDIHGAKAMEWVRAQDARTAEVLEKEKPFSQLQEKRR